MHVLIHETAPSRSQLSDLSLVFRTSYQPAPPLCLLRLPCFDFCFFFYRHTATTEIYTLSLHDALPISERSVGKTVPFRGEPVRVQKIEPGAFKGVQIAFCSAGSVQSKAYAPMLVQAGAVVIDKSSRSEEHTSELQSPYDLVCRLLLEKK